MATPGRMGEQSLADQVRLVLVGIEPTNTEVTASYTTQILGEQA